MMQFELMPKDQPSIIKVIGVGGGGSNAVNHMYKLGIRGVDFIVCNTDSQALATSPVPRKIQLGTSLTEGRGAGSIPEVGKQSAIENIDEIKNILRENTKMVFITAGMGGGTGTGAAPIIAGVAREMGILTVGICTVPFLFEGKKRRLQAEAGIEELKKNVDTLLIICNDRLREIHGNLKLQEAFAHADNILSTAAKSIAEIISVTLHINVDFADVQTVMKDSGVAIMGSAQASGENRATKAVEAVLDSPLLNDNNIEGARYILLNITSGNTEITMDEMGEITDYIQEKAGQTAEVIMGVGQDESLADKIGVTIIATGFKTKEQIVTEHVKKPEKIVYDLNSTPAPDYDNANRDSAKEEAKLNEPVLITIEEELPVTSVHNFKRAAEPVEKKFTHPFLSIKKNVEPVATPLQPAADVELMALENKTAAVENKEILQPQAIEITENDFEEIVPVVEAKEIAPELPQQKVAELIVENKVEQIIPAPVEVLPVAEVKIETPIIENKREEIIVVPVAEVKPVETITIAPVAEVKPIVEEKIEEPANEIMIEQVATDEMIATDLQEEIINEIQQEEEVKSEIQTPTPVSEIPRVFEFTDIPQPVSTASVIIDEPVIEEIKAEEKPVEKVQEKIPEPFVQVKPPVVPPAPVAQPVKAEEEKPSFTSAPSTSEAEIFQRSRERLERLKQLSYKMASPNSIAELEKEPAYKRRNVQLSNVPDSKSDVNISRTSLNDAKDNKPGLTQNNTFLHDRVD
jgi:cell division protein FtsZ